MSFCCGVERKTDNFCSACGKRLAPPAKAQLITHLMQQVVKMEKLVGEAEGLNRPETLKRRHARLRRWQSWLDYVQQSKLEDET